MDSDKGERRQNQEQVVCKEYISNGICMKSWIRMIGYTINHICFAIAVAYFDHSISLLPSIVLESQGLLVSKYRDNLFNELVSIGTRKTLS